MSDNLKKRTLTALIWSFIDKCGQQVLYFISGVILANLLTPDDYGKIGVLTIFITLSSILIDSGFGSALIRKKEASNADFSTIFYFNLGISILFYIILFFSAPFIADFFEIPSLTLICRILFLSIILHGFSLIQQVQFTKQIAFTHLARINIIAILIGSTTAILYALIEGGVWALVIQQLVTALAKAVMLWIFSKWRPTATFRKESLKESLAYSSNLIGTGLLNAIYNNIYTLLIGKIYGTTSVGYYSQAFKFQDIPSSLIALIFRSVGFPVLASVNDDHERMIRIFRKYIRTIAFFIFPLMMLLIVVADPFIRILLTDKWEATIPYLQLLCIAGAFSPFIIFYYDLFNTIGRSDINFKTELVKKLSLTIGIVCCFSQGIISLIWLWVAYTLLSLLASVVLGAHYTGYRTRQFLRDIAPSLAITILSGIGAAIVYRYSDTNLLRLLLPSIAFASLYILAGRIARIEMWREIRILLGKESPNDETR